jgi:predicted Zn-dependent peptidase
MNIKTCLTTIAIGALSIGAHAQDVTEMNINGLKVIFKPSSKQTVSAAMFFKGGTANYTQQQQGIESVAFGATSECGTGKYNKDAFKDMADKYGIGMGGNSGYDYGYITMGCVKPYFNQGWELFVQAVTNPTFENKDVELLKQQLVSGLKEQEGDPDNKLSQMAMNNAFANTRYAYRPNGTPESVASFTAASLKDYYYKTALNRNRMVLVVVGNLDVADLKKKIEAGFGKLPATPLGTLPSAAPYRVAANNLVKEDRKLATNYIMGVMGAPESTTPAFSAYRLGVDILSDKLFEEVRTKRNLSYAPSSFVTSGMQPYSGIYVTTTKPKEAVTVMVDEIKRLRNGGFTEVELRDAKSQFATSYFMKNQSNAAIAMSLGGAEMKGTWQNETKLLDKINAVSLTQMQSVFKEYAEGIKWNYLGDESQIDQPAFDKKTQN